MEQIRVVLFEPVGCLAEFPPEPFLEIASQLCGRKKQATKSGSRAYWHLLNLMETSSAGAFDDLEIEVVDAATVYDDVLPALSQLQTMGVQRFIASSLSHAAIARFLERCPHSFDGVRTRDNSGGIKAAPLVRALEAASVRPQHAMYLTDTVEGLKVARTVGVNPILMMNDPDESRRLALQNPAGGVVSLHELPDFVRLVQAQGLRA